VKVFLVIFSILFFAVANSKESEMVIVELDSNSIKVEGNPVDDLLKSLNSLPQCDSVHLLVDRNMDHGKVAEIMQIVKKSNCENISIQSV
jgi:biopolymer transport protein ExbD